MNSGNYRLKSVEATQNDQKYVAEFDNNYKNLPEQGLIIMKIKVKNELVEAVQTEKSRTRQINKITFKIQKNRIQELKIRRW